jgi:SAM-dependent methyltransferase
MSTTIAPSNQGQASAWGGDEGAYWAQHHHIFEASLARYEPAFLKAAAIQPGESVLDVGCGTGVTARAAARAAEDGPVVGVDLSRDMLAVAERLAAEAETDNVRFLQADAQIYPFAAESFDIVVSRTGSMFFGDPEAAFSNFHRSLRSGGRLCLLTWRSVEHQEWAYTFSEALTGRTPPAPTPGEPGPFSLSDSRYVRELLETTGFREITVSPVDETTTYGATADEAHTFLLGLLGWMVKDQNPHRLKESVKALRAALAAHQTDDGVRFKSAAWLVTAVRD